MSSLEPRRIEPGRLRPTTIQPQNLQSSSPNLLAWTRSRNNRWSAPTGLNNRSDAVVSALSGVPAETARAQSYMPTYERRLASAEAFGGGYEEESPPGLLQKTFEFLTMPQSMITGFTTAMLGMDRAENERRSVMPDMIGPDESRMDAAKRRMANAFLGEEYYTFRDFGKLASAAAEKDASIWTRSIAAVFGFGLDIVMDPLTYVSFGGSVMGRKYVARHLATADTGLMDVAREAHRAKQFSYKRFFSDAIERNVVDERVLVGRYQAALKKVAEERSVDGFAIKVNQRHLDDIANTLLDENFIDKFLEVGVRIGREDSANSAIGTVNYLGRVLEETLPEAAGLMYGANGSANLRRWANQQFGRAGEAWWQGLSQDIRGGVRIRLPFYRDANGLPKAWALRGVGGGELSNQYPVIRSMLDFSEGARNWVATKTGRLTGKMSGRSGEIWAEAIAAARGKAARDGSVTFADWRGFERSWDMAEQAGIIFDDRLTRDYMQGHYNYNKSIERFGEKFKTQFDILFHDEDTLRAAERALREGNMVAYAGGTEAAQIVESAIASARVWRDLLDDIGETAIEIFGDAEVAMNFLRNHVPRVTEARHSAVRSAQTGSSFRASGATPDIAKTRTAFAGGWYITNKDGAQVLRWLPASDANRYMLGTPEMKEIMGPLFVEDPTKFLPMYISEVRSALRDYRITNELHRAGLFVNMPVRPERDFDVSEIWGKVVDLVSPRETGIQGALTPPRLEEYRRLLEAHSIPKLMDQPEDFFDKARSLLDVLRDTVKWMEPYTMPNNSIMYRRLYSYDEATSYNIVMDEDLARSLGLYKRSDWQAIKNEPRYYNPLDNSYIEPAPFQVHQAAGDNGWVIKVGRGKNPRTILREDGQFFSNRTEAADFMRITNKEEYRRRFVNYVTDMQRLAIDATKNILNEVPNIAQYLVSPPRLAQAADIVEEQRMIQEAVEYLYTIVQRFGRAEGLAEVSAAGRPVLRESPTLRVEERIPVEMIGWAQQKKLVDITGVDLDTGAREAYLASMEVRGRIAENLSARYAPLKLMETIGRLFEVRQSPNNAMKDFIENIYKPFYAVQKVGMTLFRGTGFVHRNIMGGLWLGYLTGVSSKETLPASNVVITAAKTLRKIRSQMGSNFDMEPMEAARLMKEEFEKSIRTQFRGTGSILPNRKDSDAIIELWAMFHKNGLDGRRRTSRIMGEILDSSTAMGRTGGLRLQRQPGSRASDYLKVDTDRGAYFVLEDELTKMDQVLRFAMDNPWINFMSNYAEMSEDFMRFAAFVRASKDIGVRDGGYAAGLFVKATHFDYADLSNFERDYLKLMFPFYTWMRYNIPMQFRALIHEPGRISNAIKLQESMAYIFSNDSEQNYPYASFVAEKIGFTIPKSAFDRLPEPLRPTGDVSLGMMWGEPALDINRMFRVPGAFTGSSIGRAAATIINPRELFGMMNPGIASVSGIYQGYSRGEPAIMAGMDEPAPRWMAWALNRTDPATGEKVVSRLLTETLRGIFPQLGVIERIAAPVAGGERTQGRWLTSLASSLTGFSFSTEDDFKAASEILRRSTLIKQQFDSQFGPESANARQMLVQKLLDAGASMDYIKALDIAMIPDEALDVDQYVSAYFFIQAAARMLNTGQSELDIALSLSQYMADDQYGPQMRTLMAIFARRYVSDARRRVRLFGLQEASEEDLRRIGLTPRQVAEMSREEQEEIVRMLNPGL